MKRIAFCALALFSGFVVTSAQAQGVKWHPGHYVMFAAGDSQAQHMRNIDEVAREPSLQGVQIRIWWHQLEKSKGVYDFSSIDAYLSKLKSLSTPKRLVIRIMDRKFNTTSPSGIVPSYLTTESVYKGGVVKSSTGYVARLWEAPVMDRLIALYKAMGSRYDADPYFEGIATTESTLALPKTSLPSGYSHAALGTQWERLANSVRPSMPRSNLFVFTNWLGNDSLMGTLIQELSQVPVAIGGPNVIPNDPTQAQRVWTGQFGADYRGLLAIGASVEHGELGGNLGNFTPKQINDYAYNTLRVNHIFWIRNTWSGSSAQRWATGILPFLRTNPPIRTTCPSAYGICVK